MKIRFEEQFVKSLAQKIDYIANDNPSASVKFKNDILQKCKDVVDMPYKHRKFIYHEDENVRDLIHKGYTAVYMVEEDFISFVALIDHERYAL
ncbi:MAG: type II toxin-antitoxin system RelE/ParE family toxin [Epsilonproteobacteria bacterium]|nr:type II toxin-antitoxin system RelE/ParE family toxin [Campylobacterota bacterium]